MSQNEKVASAYLNVMPWKTAVYMHYIYKYSSKQLGTTTSMSTRRYTFKCILKTQHAIAGENCIMGALPGGAVELNLNVYGQMTKPNAVMAKYSPTLS